MILMLSGAVTPDDRVSGLELGADDYLGKPFHFRELVLRIRALARRQPEARPQVLRRAGLELDPLRHTAFRDGQPLNLSAKEFAVLEAFMQTRSVISAEHLLEQVWDEHECAAAHSRVIASRDAQGRRHGARSPFSIDCSIEVTTAIAYTPALGLTPKVAKTRITHTKTGARASDGEDGRRASCSLAWCERVGAAFGAAGLASRPLSGKYSPRLPRARRLLGAGRPTRRGLDRS